MSDMTVPEPLQKRPTSLTVMGVLGIIFSGMGLLGVLSGCAGVLCLQSVFGNLLKRIPDGTGDIAGMMQGFIQNMTIYTAVASVVGLVVGVIGLTGTIGLVSDKRWSKGLCTAYSCVLFVTSIGSAVANVLILSPLMQAYMDALQSYTSSMSLYNSNPFSGIYGSGFQTFSGVLGGILGCVFPALMLIFLNTSAAKTYFARLAAREHGPSR